MSIDIYIRVNDKPLTLRRRLYLAFIFAHLAYFQLIGRRYQLNLLDCEQGEAMAARS